MSQLALKSKKIALDDNKRETVRQNLKLVKMIASKIAIFLPRHIDYEDLIHEGILGLMDAAVKFNAKMGMKFTSYASIRIRGAILDSLRSMDWVPRRIRKISKKIDKVRENLSQKLGRTPTIEEISQELDIPPEKLREVMSDVEHAHLLSFEDLQSFTNRYYVQESKLSSVAQTDGVTDFERVEIKENLKVALKNLGERERLVLSLYYIEDLNLKEIKHILNISEARISQIHTNSLKKLRQYIKEGKIEGSRRKRKN